MDERVCDRCIGDDLLGREIRRHGTPEACTFCKRDDPTTVPLAELAPRIGKKFRECYRPGDMSRDLDHQEGEPLTWRLQEMLGADSEVGDALAAWLEENESPSDRENLDDTWFVDAVHFVERESSREPWHTWSRFSWLAKHEGRFWNPEVRTLLDALFKDMHSLVMPVEPSLFDDVQGTESPFLTIHPDDELSVIYRARRVRSEKQAEQFATAAAREVGSPPAELATPGRMNAGGIVVFYGAFSEETSVAELRPRVGELAVCARFTLLRPVRVLDFTVFNQHYLRESVFAPEHARRASTLQFLKQIGELLARPVQSHEELLDYVPTQMLVEYLHHVHRIDGLIYPSAQSDARVRRTALSMAMPAVLLRRQSNIVLFHHASRVAGGHEIVNGGQDIEADAAAGDARVPTLSLDVRDDGSWPKSPVRLVTTRRVAVGYETIPLDTTPVTKENVPDPEDAFDDL